MRAIHISGNIVRCGYPFFNYALYITLEAVEGRLDLGSRLNTVAGRINTWRKEL
jgi:hypothetical protein